MQMLSKSYFTKGASYSPFKKKKKMKFSELLPQNYSAYAIFIPLAFIKIQKSAPSVQIRTWTSRNLQI